MGVLVRRLCNFRHNWPSLNLFSVVTWLFSAKLDKMWDIGFSISNSVLRKVSFGMVMNIGKTFRIVSTILNDGLSKQSETSYLCTLPFQINLALKLNLIKKAHILSSLVIPINLQKDLWVQSPYYWFSPMALRQCRLPAGRSTDCKLHNRQWIFQLII